MELEEGVKSCEPYWSGTEVVVGEGVIAGRGKYHQDHVLHQQDIQNTLSFAPNPKNCLIISTLRLRGRADDDGWRAGGDL